MVSVAGTYEHLPALTVGGSICHPGTEAHRYSRVSKRASMPQIEYVFDLRMIRLNGENRAVAIIADALMERQFGLQLPRPVRTRGWSHMAQIDAQPVTFIPGISQPLGAETYSAMRILAEGNPAYVQRRVVARSQG